MSPDEQDAAEQLDDEAVDAADYPPEQPLGVEEFGVTAVEEEGRESVVQRDRREDHRADLREPPPPVANMIEPDMTDAPGLADDTAELVADRADEPDILSAEEAAMHLLEESSDRDVEGLPGEDLDTSSDPVESTDN
jgi:hypothetical protein